MTSFDVEENSDVQNTLSVVDTFLMKLKGSEWLSQNSKDEIKDCVQCAKEIESIFETLANRNSLENFVALLPSLYGLNIDVLCKVCDVALEMTLTAPGVSLSCVRACIVEYFRLCGSERFEHALSTVIHQSEVYRVLLDYLASSDGELQQPGCMMQSQLLSHIWKNECDTQKLKDLMYRWLKADASGQNMSVALQIVNLEGGDKRVTSCLVSTLVKLLLERGDQAVLFWRVLFKRPQAIEALEKYDELLDGVLEFLKSSGQWMEATPNFNWKSREKGPCRALGFTELTSAIKCMVHSKGSLADRTRKFLSKRRNSEGCTLWDDIDVSLTVL